MGAPGGQIEFRSKQTLGHSAFQSLPKKAITPVKRELIHQRQEVEIYLSA
jgi:hypothetical protein